MFRLSLTLVLALAISANFVLTAVVIQAGPMNLKPGSLVSSKKNNNQIEESPMVPEESHTNVTRNNSRLKEDQQKDQQKDDALKEQAKKSSATTLTIKDITMLTVQNASQKATRPIEETTPMTKEESVTQKTGSFTGEQANLNQCCATPGDEEEEDVTMIETPKGKQTSTGTTTLTIVVATLKSTGVTAIDEIDPPKIFPDKNVQSIADAPKDIIDRLTPTMYKTVTSELANVTEKTTSKTFNATVTTTMTTTAATAVASATTNAVNNRVESKNGTTLLEGLEDLQQAELSEKSKESSDGSKDDSMPAGIIVLVTAITFAAAIAIGYISMVAWKQYLQHRYGRRELLVNELEFDTNDLRHFEL